MNFVDLKDKKRNTTIKRKGLVSNVKTSMASKASMMQASDDGFGDEDNTISKRRNPFYQ